MNNIVKLRIAALALLFLGAFASGVRAQLTVTFDFVDFGTSGSWSSLHNDDWDGSTTNAVKQSAAESVIRAAGDYWEAAFASSTVSLTQSIDVTWGARGGSTLASGGTSFFNSAPDYPFAGGSLIWDNDGTSNFFVDLTPAENSEYAKESTRTGDLGGGTLQLERTFYNPASGTSPYLYNDMLTIAIHEVGHALGVLGSYPLYANLDTNNDGYLELVGGTEVEFSGGHLTETLAPPESPGYPFDGASIGTYYPSVLGPSSVRATRLLPASLDVLTLASMHGFDSWVYLPVIPEPGTGSLLLLASSVLLGRRRR
jgi:hypothetical protein